MKKVIEIFKDICCYLLGFIYKMLIWPKKNANFFVAIATLITSVVACCLSYQQTKIVDNQLDMMRREKQPIFEISNTIISVNNDSIADTECLKIQIIKNEVQEITAVNCYTYYKIERYIHNEKLMRTDTIVYFPVIDYFGAHGGPYKHKGIIVNDTTVGNYQCLSNFRGECLNKTISGKRKDNVGYSCDRVYFIKISYKDVYGIDNVVYYEGTNISTKEQYQNIEDQSIAVFGNNSLSVFMITLDEIISRCFLKSR